MSSLTVLADTKVLVAAGILCAVEFLADKIPWLDSAWDSVHTFVRPVAAIALASTALGTVDPVAKTIVALMCGGVALTAHSTKAATRLAVNHSPEPVSNVMVSFAEDVLAAGGLWFVAAYPGIFLVLVLLFVAAFAYFAPKVFRFIRLELVALGSLIGRLSGIGPTVEASLPKGALADGNARELWELLRTSIDVLPSDFNNKAGVSVGVRAAATRSLSGLSRSVGYLCIREKKLTFITRRWFKTVAHSIPYAEIRAVRWKNGIFLNQLIIEDSRNAVIEFDIFKVSPNPAAQPAAVPVAG
jgi:hypothetical protein